MAASGDVYLSAIGRVSARVRSWSVADEATAIPACPGWSARDLVAHLAGGAADHEVGRLDGFPGPSWTSRHIRERASRPIRDVHAELLDLAARTAARCDQRPEGPNSSWDAYVHERDLAAAFDGQCQSLDEDGHRLLRDIGTFLAERAPFEVELRRVGQAVHITVADRQVHLATVAAPAVFRAMTGRGTPAEIGNWEWAPTPPPGSVLDQLSLF